MKSDAGTGGEPLDPPTRLKFERRVQRLFDEVVGLAPNARRLLLEELPESDREVRHAVERLLMEDDAAEADGESFLDHPLLLPTEALRPPSYVGLEIGPYVLRELLGEGGTGSVYLGTRVDGQFDQQVAVKLIRTHLSSPMAERRVRAERQILASLEHPNIARLIDGGTSNQGLPYVVMELVDGAPLVEYCDSTGATIERRLELFRQVCASVHYAHRRLVVHRDLKPSNIMVTADGTPKLLDFGIAKLLDNEILDDEKPDPTETEYRALTPGYASPEQLTGQPVTTASDIYSLGVILYELVSGLRPYHRGTDTPAQLAARLERQPPLAPSAALTRVESATIERLAHDRSLTGPELQRSLGGDLDRIVAKAMAVDPEERYGSAQQFAEDVERFLAGLPVIAQPPVWTYRLAKFVRRHRLPLLAAVGALAAILFFAAFAALKSIDLERQRDAAVAARLEADYERRRSEAITRFLQDAFALADPGETRGDVVTAREVLESGAARVRQGLRDQPELQADLLESLADVYINLGNYDQAGSLAEEALRSRRERPNNLASGLKLAHSLDTLGAARLYQQRFAEAEALFVESLELRRAALVDSAEADVANGQAARPVEAEGIATSLFYLAYLHQWQGRQEEAEAAARRSLQLRRDASAGHSDVPSAAIADSCYLLGQVLTTSESPEAAKPPLVEASEQYRRLGQGFERKLATSLHAIGKLEAQLGDPEAADVALREAIELNQGLLGDHPLVADQLISWATILRDRGEWTEAELALREAIRMYEVAGGEADDLTIAGWVHLGHLLLQKPDLDAAQAPLLRALALSRQSLDANDLRLGSVLNNVISLHLRRGEVGLAKPLCREVLPLRRRQLAEDVGSPEQLQTGLANSLLLCGEIDDLGGSSKAAEDKLLEARSLFERNQAIWRLAVVDSVLGALRAKQGDASAEELLQTSLATLEELRPGSFYEDAARQRAAGLDPYPGERTSSGATR
ncbi:MAG: serine/threonine-protein kinase [Thermoanaerobaculia bacterium]|nr:serine/threonine-protein kinase [Thermoanaerobaculia bacterium]